MGYKETKYICRRSSRAYVKAAAVFFNFLSLRKEGQEDCGFSATEKCWDMRVGEDDFIGLIFV